MSTERGPAIPGPDEFDRQLRDLTSGSAGAAKFREPSAEERAKQAGQPGPGRRPGRRPRWRNGAKARELRKPVSSPRPGSGAAWRRRRLRVVGGSSTRRPSPSARRARLRSIAKMAAILVGFVALLILLHELGLGPQ